MYSDSAIKTYLPVQVTTDRPPTAPGPAKVPQRGLSVNSTDPNSEVSLCIVTKPTRTEISLVRAAQQSSLSTIVTLNTYNQIKNQYIFYCLLEPHIYLPYLQSRGQYSEQDKRHLFLSEIILHQTTLSISACQSH